MYTTYRRRRRDLVKQAKAEAEDAKVGIRNARQDANKELKTGNFRRFASMQRLMFKN